MLRVETSFPNEPVIDLEFEKKMIEFEMSLSDTCDISPKVLEAIKGDKGDKGDPGPSADIPLTDVQINRTSIVADKVANIPIASTTDYGACMVGSTYGTKMVSGKMAIFKASNSDIDARTHNYRPIVPYNLDYAVKSALCDGSGSEWTEEEQNACRERIGDLDTGSYEDAAELTLDGTSKTIEVEFVNAYKKLLIYIEVPITSSSVPYSTLYTKIDGTYKAFARTNSMSSASYKGITVLLSEIRNGRTWTDCAMASNSLTNAANGSISPINVYGTELVKFTNVRFSLGANPPNDTKIIIKGVRV